MRAIRAWVWSGLLVLVLGATTVSAQTGSPSQPWDALINDSWIGPAVTTYMYPANSVVNYEIQFRDAALTGPKADQAKGMKALRFRHGNKTTGHLFTYQQTGDFEIVNFGNDWVYYDFIITLTIEADEIPDDFSFSFSAHDPNQWDATLGPGDFTFYDHPEYDTLRPSGYYSDTDPCSEPLATLYDSDGYTTDIDPNHPLRHEIDSGWVGVVLASNVTLNPVGGSVRVYYQFDNLPAPVALNAYFIQNGVIMHTNRTQIDQNNAGSPISTFEIVPLKPDLDGDGDVDVIDLDIFCAHWLQTAESDSGWISRADLHRDGRIDLRDYSLFCSIWLAGH